MSDITFSASMDEKDVQRALQNMVKENAKLRAEIGLGVQEAKAAAAQEREWQKLREKATKEATQQMQQLNAAAQRIKDSVATPFEEAKKKTAELRDHLQAGRLTVDEYRAAYARVAKELKEASRDHAAETEAAREHTRAVREAAMIAEKYATKEERVSAELKRLNALKDKGVLSSKDHARAVEAENAKLDDNGGLIGELTSKMGGFVAGLGTASAAIAVIKSEYDALIERQGKSADSNISLAAEQEGLLMNLGGADAAEVAGNIRKMSKRSGIKEENVTRAVNEAMAARGDMSVDSVVDAVGSVSKIRKFAPSEMAGLAAATIDTQKQTGLGTDEALGFLLQMQGQSRTKNLKGLAENFTPAIGGVMNFGADRQTAGALLAALSHGMGDTTGAMTGTSGIQLAKQLREFSGGADIGTAIAQLQQDPEMRKKFLSTAAFEAKAIPAVESLLTGGTQAKQFAAARQALSADPTIALNEAIASRSASSAIGLAEKDQAFANFADQQRLGDLGGAESAIARKRLQEIRDQSGRVRLASGAQAMIEDITSGGRRTGADTVRSIENEIRDLESGGTLESRTGTALADSVLPGAGTLFSGVRTRSASSQENQESIALLKELLEVTKQQLATDNAKVDAGKVAGRAAEGREGAR